MRPVTLVALALILAPPLSGCSRPHLWPGAGRSTRESLAMQQAPPSKTRTEPSMALDTQEAAVVAGSYLQGLGVAKAGGKPPPVVMVEQPSQGHQPVAPSVPK